MHYEHDITVNDPANPLEKKLTRHQLWQGLLLKVTAPERFLPSVEAIQITEYSTDLWIRDMQLGQIKVRDRIHFQHHQEIRFETEPNAQHAGGTLVVTIMEPKPELLLVRFIYQKPDSPDPDEEKLSAYLCKMWQKIDQDSVQLIRNLAEQGQL